MIDKEKVINNLEAIWVCCKNRQSIKAYDEIEREMYADWEAIVNDAIILLKEQPEIIRCKDCKYGVICTQYRATHIPDWFCAEGKRR